jgi:hypothetical protein
MTIPTITTSVMRRGEPRFDMGGSKLPDSLHDTDMTISDGTVKRLISYAVKRLDGAGFDVSNLDREVYTTEGNSKPSERIYCVEFINAKGGKIGVQGIMTEHGHPCLDHGLSIQDS